MVQLGMIYAGQGKPAKAQDLFAQALVKDPTMLDARYRLGLCKYDRGEFAQAAELLEEVHRAKPEYDYGQAYLRLAQSQQRVGNAGRAAEVYETLLRFYPGHAEGSFGYAMLLADQGDRTRATALLKEMMFTVRHSPPFQRRRNRHWALKGRWWLLRNRAA
jgi:tetratricopeptide (TPR) repeat protein